MDSVDPILSWELSASLRDSDMQYSEYLNGNTARYPNATVELHGILSSKLKIHRMV